MNWGGRTLTKVGVSGPRQTPDSPPMAASDVRRFFILQSGRTKFFNSGRIRFLKDKGLVRLKDRLGLRMLQIPQKRTEVDEWCPRGVSVDVGRKRTKSVQRGPDSNVQVDWSTELVLYCSFWSWTLKSSKNNFCRIFKNYVSLWASI